MKEPQLSKDHLLLKWGTLKGYCFKNSPEAFEALKKYTEIGMNWSAMAQKDTPEQKKLLFEMIDKVNGPITNDWEGIDFESKEAAKKYITDYGKKS